MNDDRKRLLFGPCAKRRTQAVLTTVDGKVYVAENICLNPQEVCPRMPGEGYEKCKTICRQVGHAEEQVILAAGEDAVGATIEVTHWYACRACESLSHQAGVKSITCVGPQDSERTPDSSMTEAAG